jgi:hypothetical protein
LKYHRARQLILYDHPCVGKQSHLFFPMMFDVHRILPKHPAVECLIKVIGKESWSGQSGSPCRINLPSENAVTECSVWGWNRRQECRSGGNHQGMFMLPRN